MRSIDDVFKYLILLKLCLYFNPVCYTFEELIQARAELFDLFEDLSLLLKIRPMTQHQKHEFLSFSTFKLIESLFKVKYSELLDGCLQKSHFCFLRTWRKKALKDFNRELMHITAINFLEHVWANLMLQYRSLYRN